MFIIDGYIVRTKSNDRFYGVDEMREAMAGAYLKQPVRALASMLHMDSAPKKI